MTTRDGQTDVDATRRDATRRDYRKAAMVSFAAGGRHRNGPQRWRSAAGDTQGTPRRKGRQQRPAGRPAGRAMRINLGGGRSAGRRVSVATDRLQACAADDENDRAA